MPRVTDPALLQQLGSPAAISTGGLKPPEGYHRVSPTMVAPDVGGPKDLPVITAQAAAEARARAGASTPIEVAGQIEAARAKAAIELQQAAAQREAERQFKLQQTPQQRQQANLSNDEVMQAIQQARDIVNAGHAVGLTGQIMGRFGGTNATDLNGTLNTIKGNLTLDNLQKLKAASTTGASGMGSLTEKEGELLASTVASLDQKQSPEKMLDSIAKVENHYRRWSALNNGEDPSNPDVAKRYGLMAAPPSANNGSGPQGGGPQDPFSGPSSQDMGPSGGMQTVADPVLSGVNDHLRSLIAGGATGDQARAYLDQVSPGLGSRVQNIDQWVAYHKQRPGAPIDVSVETKEVPMSNLKGALNTVAQSPLGAYGMSSADALTAGFLDNMTSNPAMARAAMQAGSQINPKASLLGTATGAGLAGFGAEGVGALAGAGRFAAPVADSLYGAAYGAGSSDEGSRLGGALEGAVLGGLGGQASRMAFRGAGNAISGVRNADVQALRQAGVDNMTLGQIVGQSGGVGRWLKGREDRLTGFNGIGEKINNQRNNSLRSFNQAAFNEGLAPIGVPPVNSLGELGVEQALGATNQGYRTALGGVNVQPDAQFDADYGAAVNHGAGISRTGPDFQSYVDNRFAPFVQQPNINGAQIQDMMQGVQKANFGTDSMGDLASRATQRVGASIEDLVNRQAPGAMEGLGNANAAYRNTNILADAVGRAMNTDGIFTPAQLGQAARANATKYTGKLNAATTDRPFFDLQRAGQNVLPNKIADSGTAGRIASDGGLTSTLKAAVRNAVNAPLYSDTLNPALNRILLDRPQGAATLADFVLGAPTRVGGMFGRQAVLNNGLPFGILTGFNGQ